METTNLLNLLIEETKSGKIKWKREKRNFKAEHDKYKLKIKTKNGDGYRNMKISIKTEDSYAFLSKKEIEGPKFNEEGNEEIETLSMLTNIIKEKIENEEIRNWNKLREDLHTLLNIEKMGKK